MSDTVARQIDFDDLRSARSPSILTDQEPQEVIEWALDALGDGVVVVLPAGRRNGHPLHGLPA